MLESMPTPLTITRENLSEVFSAESFVIPLMKEAGYSSGFFVNQIRYRLSKARGVKRFKVGHAGTLDPFADGVLLVLCGKATKLQDFYMKAGKEYICTVRFGASTPSLDLDTEINAEDQGFGLSDNALAEAIRAILPEFVGEHEQMPPRFSAKHVDGKRAYQLARQGDEVEIKLSPKLVRCDEVELLSIEEKSARIRLACGSGYYVRSFGRDLAARLGTLGYLTQLSRSKSAGFSAEECLKLREVLDASEGV